MRLLSRTQKEPLAFVGLRTHAPPTAEAAPFPLRLQRHEPETWNRNSFVPSISGSLFQNQFGQHLVLDPRQTSKQGGGELSPHLISSQSSQGNTTSNHPSWEGATRPTTPRYTSFGFLDLSSRSRGQAALSCAEGRGGHDETPAGGPTHNFLVPSGLLLAIAHC